ncbi:MAG: hypothetical protein MJ126_04660 [Lachnospiraceae bacterium]|nr:hypothetical protein [Lachnospiraceae bacterium]
MKLTNSKVYDDAINDNLYGRIHDISDTWIENVLVNDEWKMVGFQKVDARCFILIGTRNWATKYTAMNLHEAICSETWYEVDKAEGNSIYNKILKSKRTSKKGKEYYIFKFTEVES